MLLVRLIFDLIKYRDFIRLVNCDISKKVKMCRNSTVIYINISDFIKLS